MLNFKNVSLATVALTSVLFGLLLLVPDFIFFIFGIEGGEAARLLSRRAAMLFLGLAILSYFGRNAEHSIMRQAVCLGMAASMFGLALTGTYEFVRGYAGGGILLAVVAEIGFGAAYVRIWMKNR